MSKLTKKRESKDFAQRPFVMFDAALLSWLQPLELVTYLQIKRRAGLDGGCWESIAHMAEETGMSTSSIKRSIRSLLQKNLIAKTRRKGGTDLYVMTPPEEWRFEKLVEQVTEHSSVRATEHSSVRATEHSSVRATNKIPFKIDPDLDLITNFLTLTGEPEKSAYAEANLISQETGTLTTHYEFASESTKPSGLNELEDTQNLLNEETYQPNREGADESLLEGCENRNDSSLEVNPDPSGDISAAPPRSISIDKTKTVFGKPTLKFHQQERAQSSSHLQRGIENKRWKDRADFEKFRAYAIEWARLRREGIAPGTQGQKYDQKWIETVLSRTATCTIKDSPILVCWKNWQLEKQAASPEIVTQAPVVPAGDNNRVLSILEKLRADNEAAKKLREEQKQESKKLLEEFLSVA